MVAKRAEDMNGIPNLVFATNCVFGEREMLSHHLDGSKSHRFGTHHLEPRLLNTYLERSSEIHKTSGSSCAKFL
jgi:hypothetical protein